MIVVDASVVVEMVINGPLAWPIRNALAERNEALAVPHLLDIEVVSALRGLVIGGRVDAHLIAEMFSELADLPAVRYPHISLVERVWELRHNFRPYDAAYIALAEQTGSVLFTCDAALARGHRASVVLFAPPKPSSK